MPLAKLEILFPACQNAFWIGEDIKKKKFLMFFEKPVKLKTAMR